MSPLDFEPTNHFVPSTAIVTTLAFDSRHDLLHQVFVNAKVGFRISLDSNVGISILHFASG